MVQEIDEDYFTIGNATSEEIFLKIVVDRLYSSLKREGKIEEVWGGSEERARNEIRSIILNTEKGREELEKAKKETPYKGIGYDGSWVVKVDEAIKDAKETYDYVLKSRKYKPSSSITYQDIFAEVFMRYIDRKVVEEVAHSECNYRHEGKLTECGRGNFFLDFIHLNPIRTIQKENTS